MNKKKKEAKPHIRFLSIYLTSASKFAQLAENGIPGRDDGFCTSSSRKGKTNTCYQNMHRNSGKIILSKGSGGHTSFFFVSNWFGEIKFFLEWFAPNNCLINAQVSSRCIIICNKAAAALFNYSNINQKALNFHYLPVCSEWHKFEQVLANQSCKPNLTP